MKREEIPRQVADPPGQTTQEAFPARQAGLPVAHPLFPDLAASAGLRRDHATLIADPALPGKWQPGEEVVYLLVFDVELLDGPTQVNHAKRMLTFRLSETLSIPIRDEWYESLWESGQMQNLIVGLETNGDCEDGYLVQLMETKWKEVITKLLIERKIRISGN